jgi:hypothetical protein
MPSRHQRRERKRHHSRHAARCGEARRSAPRAFFPSFSCRRERFRTSDPDRVKATIMSLRGVTSRYSQVALN